jgi:starvation-inducible DNA-binding protein
LDEYAPGTFSEFMKLSSIPEAKGVPGAQSMVAELLDGHEALARIARTTIPAAEKGNDEATLDLLTQRIQLHEKTAWMLRSLLRD